MRAIFLLLTVFLLSACASRVEPPNDSSRYRVTWTARSAADHTPLVHVVSPPMRIGEKLLVKTTNSTVAEENRPAFPLFMARLSPDPRRGLIQVVTKASMLEAVRNKKGKVKINKRNIGGLLPMHPGETLGVNGPGDPIDLQVTLESAR